MISDNCLVKISMLSPANREISVPGLIAVALLILSALPLKAEEFIPKFLATVEASMLQTNTENKVKKRVNKCEADGINDIRKLASPFEEFWAYIPVKCSWIELGILEKIRGGIKIDRNGRCKPPSTISGIRKKDVIALIKETSDLVLYHPHPSNKSIVDHALDAKKTNNLSASCLNQARTETLEAALPGLPDLSSLFTFARIFYRMRPSGQFAERIVSVYGVTEYSLTKHGEKALDAGEFSNSVRQEMRQYFNARNSLGKDAYKASPSSEINAQRINDQLRILNPKGGLFRIKFMPFN